MCSLTSERCYRQQEARTWIHSDAVARMLSMAQSSMTLASGTDWGQLEALMSNPTSKQLARARQGSERCRPSAKGPASDGDDEGWRTWEQLAQLVVLHGA